jgi:hypothetical protein
MNYHNYKSCIDACMQCVAISNHCASMGLKEKDVTMMARCIQLDMECAAICLATAQLLSLGSEGAKELCKLCSEICQRCADECSKHDVGHCKECAEACIKCISECNKVTKS